MLIIFITRLNARDAVNFPILNTQLCSICLLIMHEASASSTASLSKSLSRVFKWELIPVFKPTSLTLPKFVTLQG